MTVLTAPRPPASFLRGIASRPPVACLCPALPAAPLDNSRCPIVVLQDPRTQVNIGTVQLLSLGFSHCSVLQGQEFPEGQYPGKAGFRCGPSKLGLG